MATQKIEQNFAFLILTFVDTEETLCVVTGVCTLWSIADYL